MLSFYETFMAEDDDRPSWAKIPNTEVDEKALRLPPIDKMAQWEDIYSAIHELVDQGVQLTGTEEGYLRNCILTGEAGPGLIIPLIRAGHASLLFESNAGGMEDISEDDVAYAVVFGTAKSRSTIQILSLMVLCKKSDPWRHPVLAALFMSALVCVTQDPGCISKHDFWIYRRACHSLNDIIPGFGVPKGISRRGDERAPKRRRLAN